MTKQSIVDALISGASKGVANVLLLPLTFLLLKGALWFLADWAALPEMTNRQIMVVALLIAIFA